jgi:uncharacterized protein YndB with AHSA1/START domain
MDTHLATRELRMTRHIPAPPDAVFAAWTEAARVQQWFGPYGMTVPVAEIDLRAGGTHHTVMRDAEGKEYPNRLAIEEVAAPHRLVLRVVNEDCGPLVGATGTLGFAPEGEGTRLTVAWHHPTEEMRAAHEAMGFAKGWGETLDKLVAHVMAPAEGCPGAVPPSPQHGWLLRMIGEWEYQTECTMGPGEPMMQARGRERVRSLGGYWVLGEAEGDMPGGGTARWIVTMGFDAAAQTFRGTFVGSMMPHMFVYAGKLAEDGKTLALDTEGPAMTGEGTARYRDTITMFDDDTRELKSEVQQPDGSWTFIMSSRFTRVG